MSHKGKICALAILAVLTFAAYKQKPSYLMQVLAQEIRSAKLIANEPLPITKTINDEFKNELDLFLEVSRLRSNAFYANSQKCKCNVLIMDIPVNPIGFSFLAEQHVRFIFSFASDSIKFEDASVTRQSL